ncbi:molybdate ABC transporter substrate-binding protein [Bacillus sp. FJAT-27225]|uniref:molybdate ABC transporter substrate-binding protein n=1 Tax=Bacillus sp. FJAT-27225 TaxID=1743144 RepID=UPI00080C2953|nr:molybdate ABC transporter substrate-binding protein [Bacillus sp. FJAT-27225]OCA90519.1 molybdate ABC transporter substrate-binding protein [Bacillus sp. FJAT-27225]
MKIQPFLLFILVLALTGCSTTKQNDADHEVELTVSAAASLQNALNDIKASFEKEHPNIKINYNFGASGSLQQQISHGAPVDLFFSAAEDKFAKLEKEGRIAEMHRVDLVGNELALIVPKNSNKIIDSFETLSNADLISIGTPESVPAGQYAKEALEYMGIWNKVEEKVVPAKDVRQVLTYVETNNVEAGIVYKTDALGSDKVSIAAIADRSTHQPIVYPMGIIKDSPQLKEAKLFFDFIQTDASKKIFQKYGFLDLGD